MATNRDLLQSIVAQAGNMYNQRPDLTDELEKDTGELHEILRRADNAMDEAADWDPDE